MARTWLFALVALAGCSTSPPEEAPLPGELRSSLRRETPGASEEASAALQAGTARFAIDLYRDASGDENFVLSPHSISTAFAMLRAGAKGETAAQIDEAFGYPEGNDLYEAANSLDQALSSREREGVRLDIANAAFLQEGYGVAPTFLDALAVSFGAGIGALDFNQPELAAGEVNGWVSDRTQGLIEELVTAEVVDGASFVLVNAIYFHGTWAEPFKRSNTEDGPFTRRDGTVVNTPLMHDSRAIPYASFEGYEAGELSYEGDELAMLVIAPSTPEGITELEEQLSPEWLDTVVDGLAEREDVLVTIPRFKLESELALDESLQNLGVTDAFDGDLADLSGIPLDGARDLYVSAALHKATIEVNEEGTEAAAATGIVGHATSAPADPPPSLDLDRPFLFFIRDRATGAILFSGRVADPS